MFNVKGQQLNQPTLQGGEVPIGRLGFKCGSYLIIEGVRQDGMKTGTSTLLVDTVNSVWQKRHKGLILNNLY